MENCASYVRSWSDVEFFEDSIQALSDYKQVPYLFVLVTNQSVIGRGLETLEKISSINDQIVGVVKERGGRIDGVYLCPHSPDEKCDCRKPQPGMLLQAAVDHDINLSESIMIGDALTDLEAGIRAGVKQTILLKTGRGTNQMQLPQFSRYQSSLIYNNLADAFKNYFQ